MSNATRITSFNTTLASTLFLFFALMCVLCAYTPYAYAHEGEGKSGTTASSTGPEPLEKDIKKFTSNGTGQRNPHAREEKIRQVEHRLGELKAKVAEYEKLLVVLKSGSTTPMNGASSTREKSWKFEERGHMGSSTPKGDQMKKFKFGDHASSTRGGMRENGIVLGASTENATENISAQIGLIGGAINLLAQIMGKGEVLGASTAAALPAPTLKVQLAAEQANLASLKKQVTAAEAKIAELTARITAGDLGVYDLFKNGVIAKRTLNISKADALAQCMKVAMANRKDKFICQWGNNTTDTITLFNSAVDTLPAELSVAEIFKNGTFLKNVNDISSADTVTMCKDLAAIPSSSYQPVICYWKGKIVYNSTTDKPTTSAEKLTVRVSAEDPGATTLQLETDKLSERYTIFTFGLDASESGPVTINRIPVTLQTNILPVGTSVDDVQLVIGGYTYKAVPGTDGKARIYTFDTEGMKMGGKESKVTAELRVQFKPLPLKGEGQTITASISASGIDAKGAAVLVGKQLVGSVKGAVHTMRTSGPSIEPGEALETLIANSESTTADDAGVFTYTFAATALAADLYIPKTAIQSSAKAAGVNFRMVDGSGIIATGGNAAASLSSTADTEGAYYVVREGESEEFTVTVTYDPETSGFYRMRLFQINWNTAAAAPIKSIALTPAADFETDPLSI